MKFSTRSYPILGHVSDPATLFKFLEIGFQESLLASPESLINLLKDHCVLSVYHGNIDYINSDFYKRATSASTFDKLSGIFHKIDSCSGILLYPKTNFSLVRSVSYNITRDSENDDVAGSIGLYSDNGMIGLLMISTNHKETRYKVVFSKSIKRKGGGDLGDWIINHIQTILALMAFKQFASIEIKEVGGNDAPKKTKIGGEKFVNDTKAKVNILGSSWFTEVHRTEGFDVTGYFRLQMTGPGRTIPKLVYVPDHRKHGYRRRARIETSK